MEKINRWLKKQEGVVFLKQVGESNYYKTCSNTKIRVSSHTGVPEPNCLRIIKAFRSENFIVVYGNKPVIFDSWAKLRTYLKNFLLIDAMRVLNVKTATYTTPVPAGLNTHNSSELAKLDSIVGQIHPSYYIGLLNMAKTMYNSAKSKQYRKQQIPTEV